MLEHGQKVDAFYKDRNATYDVFTLDIARFLSNEIANRRGQSSNSKTVAKMDIEGAEYTVFPTMLTQSNSLCSISYIGIEWHPRGTEARPHMNTGELKVLNFLTQQAKGCQTVIRNLDDESYGRKGEDHVPMDINIPLLL